MQSTPGELPAVGIERQAASLGGERRVTDKARRFALEWSEAARIDWGTILLFGGGLSLAKAMEDSGLAEWIGGSVSGLAGASTIVVLLAVAAMFVFLTEIATEVARRTSSEYRSAYRWAAPQSTAAGARPSGRCGPKTR